MAHKLSYLIPVLALSLGACTLEPSRFTGTDLLAPEPVKVETPKKAEEKIEQEKKSLPAELKSAPVLAKPEIKAETPSVEPRKVKTIAKIDVDPPKAPSAPIAITPPSRPKECRNAQPSDAAKRMIIKGDRVRVTVFRENDLTGVYQVDNAGYIAFPLIGKTAAANMTALTLQDNIKKKLASGYLVNPSVTTEILSDCNEK